MAKEPDIFALLDSVYGDSSSARESKLDNAVQSVERTQRSYTAMRQFTETGKIYITREITASSVVEATETEVRADARAIAEAAARAEASGEVPRVRRPEPMDRDATTQVMAPLDPEATEIVKRAPRATAKPPSQATKAPSAVVSGSGADFHAPGLTKTHIVRPKKWFNK